MGVINKIFKKNKIENRQAPYTDLITEAVVNQAQGNSKERANIRQVAAVEAICSLYATSLSVAVVEGNRSEVITPQFLADMIRQLILRGEAVYYIDTEFGFDLLPVSSFDIKGGANPKSWRYRVDLPTPDESTRQIKLPGEGVLHFTYSTDNTMPWKGISPLSWASLTAQQFANLEKDLTEESSGTRGYVLPVPAGTDKSTANQLKADLANLQGKTTLVESTASGFGQGLDKAPAKDWVPSRIGPNWPEPVVVQRINAEHSLYNACGVPLSLVFPGTDANTAREGWRKFIHGTLRPLSKRIEDELSRKFDSKIEFTFNDIAAADIQGRGRAFNSLTTGGLDVKNAALICGFEIDFNSLDSEAADSGLEREEENDA